MAGKPSMGRSSLWGEAGARGGGEGAEGGEGGEGGGKKECAKRPSGNVSILSFSGHGWKSPSKTQYASSEALCFLQTRAGFSRF